MRRSICIVSLAVLGTLVALGGGASAQTLPLELPELPELRDGEGARVTTAQSAGTELVGLFAIDEGSCQGAVSGSYFRMVQPGGNPSDGPFVGNGNSPCSDNTYTPLRPGTDGGIATGGFQPNPDPAFDAAGNGQADRITQPQGFFSVRFATATNPTDPQTGTEVSPPRIFADGASLSGDVRAFAASWNRQHFNQGSPKPDGSTPGNTAGPSGTYDSGTGAFTLQWSSQIVGGPFNNFTGLWHFAGTFRAGAAAETRATPAAAGSGTGEAGPGAQTRAAGAAASAPGGSLARTGGGVSTAVGLIFAGLAALPAITRRVRRRRRSA